MTPRKWFMNKIAFQWASDEEMPSRFQIRVRNPDAEDTPVYVFTEEELKDFARDIYQRASSSMQWQLNFDDYWQQKFGGK